MGGGTETPGISRPVDGSPSVVGSVEGIASIGPSEVSPGVGTGGDSGRVQPGPP